MAIEDDMSNKYTGYKQQNTLKPETINTGTGQKDEAILNEDKDINVTAEPKPQNLDEPKMGLNNMDDETKSLLTHVRQQNELLVRDLEAQKIKNAATEKKIDDVIKMATELMQNPQSLAPLLSGVMNAKSDVPVAPPNTPIEANQNVTKPVEQQPNSPVEQTTTAQPLKTIEQLKAEQMLDGARLNAINEVANTTGQIPPAFNMDSIGKLVNAIAVISSNFGKKEPAEANPMAMVNNIQSSVELAANIAGTLGSGLGKIFEGFNQMQDRAWKSWQGRSVKQNTGISKDTLKDVLREIMLEKQDDN